MKIYKHIPSIDELDNIDTLIYFKGNKKVNKERQNLYHNHVKKMKIGFSFRHFLNSLSTEEKIILRSQLLKIINENQLSFS